MKIIKIVFGLIAAVILGWIIAACAVFGIYYLRTGHILPQNPYYVNPYPATLKNVVSNSDLLTINVADSSGQPANITAQSPLERVSMPRQTPFEVSWQVSDTLSNANAVCTLVGFDGKVIQRSVGYSGMLQIPGTVGGAHTISLGYTLQCKVAEKTYTKEIAVDFQ
ncbi:MAG: hypothetical protein ACYC75_03425 [Minisyncoccota bacterium]